MGTFRKLFGNTCPAPPRTARPTLEALDERILPSTASTSIHAVADNYGTSVVFYVQDGELFESGYGRGPQQLFTKGAGVSLSAGVDQWGYADCFFTESNTFWEYYYRGRTGYLKEIFTTQNGRLAPPALGSFAADGEGNVFFVSGTSSKGNALWEWSGSTNGFTQLDTSNTLTVDAVTTVYNADNPEDVVFALRPGGVFGYYQQSWVFAQTLNLNALPTPAWSSFHQISGSDPVKAGFSAGLDQWGNADVYVEDVSGQLFKWDLGRPGWQLVAPAKSVMTFSATAYGQVDAIMANGTMVQYSNNGNVPTGVPGVTQNTFREISVPLPTSYNSWFAFEYSLNDEFYTVAPSSSGTPNVLWGYYIPTKTLNAIAGPVA